ncbi:Serine/threonine-protein phosphatase 2A 55 kDa regulatory subunit B gamma isoform [Sciurus carolinensis]|uniref:Serine/threonine-protein phosphatase 2A 55 kDa regulatory subunit B n=1 Tax=Sciurus carolinensis TaxID=30640 RepID=A0AA41NBR0_SCICA|nr:Serine/threonine-protein phosphatase 2A 55 kDa regulatory subunit B gamma isoform [Sciurus carolinensis]
MRLRLEQAPLWIILSMILVPSGHLKLGPSEELAAGLPRRPGGRPVLHLVTGRTWMRKGTRWAVSASHTQSTQAGGPAQREQSSYDDGIAVTGTVACWDPRGQVQGGPGDTETPTQRGWRDALPDVVRAHRLLRIQPEGAWAVAFTAVPRSSGGQTQADGEERQDRPGGSSLRESPSDIISTVEFNHTGELLATGDKGGRVVIFQREPESKNAPHSQGEYDVYSTFQSHEPEFDYLKSLEIEEKINKIKWLPQQNAAHSLLSTNDKTIKLWKITERDKRPEGYNLKDEEGKLKDLSTVTSLQVPVLKPMDLMVEVSPRRIFANGHTYHINSISVNSDCETYMSADDLRINLWHLAITDRSFNIVDIKPANMEDLTEVITASEFHPHHCNLFVYSSSKGSLRLCDMRAAALCDKHSKPPHAPCSPICAQRKAVHVLLATGWSAATTERDTGVTLALGERFGEGPRGECLRTSSPEVCVLSEQGWAELPGFRLRVGSATKAGPLPKVVYSPRVFEEPEDPSNRSFFSEIISSVSDVKFSHSGRYMLTRDYLTVKVWDLNMEARPIETYQPDTVGSQQLREMQPSTWSREQRGHRGAAPGASGAGGPGFLEKQALALDLEGQVHDYLRSKLCSLYENDCIFDKFECAWNGSDSVIMTGAYNNFFRMFDRNTKRDVTLEASRESSKPRAVLKPRRVCVGGKRRRDDISVDSLDFTKKILHTAWHPAENIIAIAATNNLYIFQDKVNSDMH